MHTLYIVLSHVNPYDTTGEGLREDRTYTDATYVATTACLHAHSSEHDRGNYSISRLIHVIMYAVALLILSLPLYVNHP